MAKFGFSKNTYEVWTLTQGRWTLEAECTSKAQAMELVEEVRGRNKIEGVRVTVIDDSKGTEEVVLEDVFGGDASLKPSSVDSAPVCKNPDDIYSFESRRTIGRVARQYLDSQGVTALELLFDAGRLNMLERMDGFFSSAMSMVAGVQAKQIGGKPTDCSDALYATFGRVRDAARDNKKTMEEDTQTLKTGGLGMLVSRRRKQTERLGALATYMGGAGDWGDKVLLLLDLVKPDIAAEGLALVDGALAEILDGAEATKDILAGQRDTGTALMSLAQLALGRLKPPRHASKALLGLSDLLVSDGWPLTRAVLLERVSRGLGGTRPLTREGGEEERELFIRLVRELGDTDGLGGGPLMVEAVVLRGRIAMGKNGENVPAEAVLEQTLYLLPSLAARMGMLLDACRSGLWAANGNKIMGQLAHIIKQVPSIRALVPQGTSPQETQRVIEALKERLDADDLPDMLRESLGAAFGGLLSGRADGQPSPPRTMDTSGSKTMPTDTERTEYADGTVIFEEGDDGNAAFVIAEGQVDIYRGNRVLATVGKGEIIGELALIDNQPRMATAKASGDVKVIRISPENLRNRIDRLGQTDKVMRLIMDTLVRRLRGV